MKINFMFTNNEFSTINRLINKLTDSNNNNEKKDETFKNKFFTGSLEYRDNIYVNCEFKEDFMLDIFEFVNDTGIAAIAAIKSFIDLGKKQYEKLIKKWEDPKDPDEDIINSILDDVIKDNPDAKFIGVTKTFDNTLSLDDIDERGFIKREDFRKSHFVYIHEVVYNKSDIDNIVSRENVIYTTLFRVENGKVIKDQKYSIDDAYHTIKNDLNENINNLSLDELNRIIEENRERLDYLLDNGTTEEYKNKIEEQYELIRRRRELREKEKNQDYCEEDE